MGVDLKLLIVDGRVGPNDGYSHTMLEFGRWYDVFDGLHKIERTIPGFELSGYVAKGENGDPAYGTVTKTPYGEALKYVSAAEFLACVQSFVDETGYSDQWSRACCAFVRELKPDTLIGLYWH
jgi:hypothetical protein